MLTEESFGSAKTIIDKLIPAISCDPSEASRFFAHEATMIFSQDSENSVYSVGLHSIYSFLKKLPLFNYYVQAYDCHSIHMNMELVVVIVTGTLVFQGETQVRNFHMSFHVRIREDNKSALVHAATIKIMKD